MDTGPADPNAIDGLIKYGTTIAAVAYGLGFLEYREFVGQFGSRFEASLLSAAYFVNGGMTLVESVGIALIFVLATRSDTQLVNGRSSIVAASSVACFITNFGCSLFINHSWIRDALWVGVAAAGACAFASSYLLRMGVPEAFPLFRQLKLAGVLLLALVFLAVGEGRRGARALASGQTEKIRLLVTADSIEGARQMGLDFPGWKVGDNSAQLSEGVGLVYESDRSYVLRVKGHLVHLGKEKVLGSIP